MNVLNLALRTARSVSGSQKPSLMLLTSSKPCTGLATYAYPGNKCKGSCSEETFHLSTTFNSCWALSCLSAHLWLLPYHHYVLCSPLASCVFQKNDSCQGYPSFPSLLQSEVAHSGLASVKSHYYKLLASVKNVVMPILYIYIFWPCSQQCNRPLC